jgi:hypothetical protein
MSVSSSIVEVRKQGQGAALDPPRAPPFETGSWWWFFGQSLLAVLADDPVAALKGDPSRHMR